MSLGTLVMIAVSMAIDIHLRVVDSGRTEVEEAQLARALLRRIADDLRGAVLYNPSEAENLMASMAGSAGGAASAGGSSGPAGGGSTGMEEPDESEELDADRTSDLDESTTPQSAPGLFGNRYQLQVDTSRLPRIDEYEEMLSTDDLSLTGLVSDVKTVTYYVINDRLSGATYASGVSQNGGGLVRYELDRATALYAAEQGVLVDPEPIAPEVAAIEFLYFDGTEWLDEWDSIERGGLPVAVQIAIGIIPSGVRDNPESASVWTPTLSSLAETNELLVYPLVVHLPVAQPTTGDGTSGMTTGSSEDSGDETE